MGRLGVIALALLVLLAGCGGDQRKAQPTTGSAPADLRAPTPPPARHLSFVHVIVLDGDKSTPVRGAEVRVGSQGRPDRA